jgi:pimeloyl-ACP methyl ester carboxylesterase
MQLSTIRTGLSGRTVRCFRSGQREALVFLHSLVSLDGFGSALFRLAESFDVIAPHAPGWGVARDASAQVDRGPVGLGLSTLQLLDALGVQSASVVGVSIGAWMATELAAICRDRVRRLVLVNPLDPSAQHPHALTHALFSDPALLRESLVLSGPDSPTAALIADAAWQGRIPNTRYAVLAGAGHLAEPAQPDAFASLIREFVLLDRIAAAA